MLKNHRIIKNILITISFPIAVFIISELLSLTKGTHLIGAAIDVQTIIRNTTVSCLFVFALSFNLTCGRMDMSLGSQRLVGVIIGGNIGLSLGLTGVGLLLFAILFGLLIGVVTGVIFVLTRVPAMVLGIGLGLIYECVVYFGTSGKGLSIFGIEGNEILIQPWFVLVVILFFTALFSFLLQYTKYGYHLRAIQGSQKIAKASGINVFVNAVICYTLAGGYVSAGAMIDAAMANGLECQIGLTSPGSVMGEMFPMFLGMYLARWSNQAIGLFVGSLSIQILKLSLVRLQLNNAVISIVIMVLFILFLIFLENESIFRVRKAEKARIKLAQEKKASLVKSNA